MKMPSVTISIRVRREVFEPKRTRRPTVSPTFSPKVLAIRVAAARAAILRGSSTRMRRSAAHGSPPSAKGTRVVLPAPGGATKTATLLARKAAVSSGSAASIGNGGDFPNAVFSGEVIHSDYSVSKTHILAVIMPAAQKSKPGTVTGAVAVKSATKPVKKGDHVFLVDGYGYVFRAYHALPPITRKSDGLQLNAVFGFCNMLWKLLRDMKADEQPTHLAVVLDKSEKTFRTEMYADYKAHRPDAPDDLKPQFKFIREAVRAFDLPCLEQDGFEADDLIATYVREADAAGATATIVSSDKDLMQLVNDRVIMFDAMKDKKIGRAEVIEKFGVPPDKVIEVQALIGDSTDNVPGVPGIGVKTAAQLIGEYGDLETLLGRASEIKQEKRRQALIEHAEAARLSKKLVTLDANVDLDVAIGDLAVHEPDYKRLIAFLKAMEFNGLMRRVAEFASVEAGEIEADNKLAGATAPSAPPAQSGGAPQLPLGRPAQPGNSSHAGRPQAPAYASLTPQALAGARIAAARNAKFDRSKYRALRSIGELNAVLARARDMGLVAIDTLTANSDPMQADLCGFSLAVAPNDACYVPLSHRQGAEGGAESLFSGDLAPEQITERAALDALKSVLTDPGTLKIGHDLKFAWQIFAQRGIEIAPCDDVMLMSYALDAGRQNHALDKLAEAVFTHAAVEIDKLLKPGKTKITFDFVGIDKATEYAAERADIILRLWHVLKPRLPADHVHTVYETLERPLLTCWPGWSGAAFPSTGKYCRGFPASSPRKPRRSKPRSTRLPARRSIPAAPNSSAIFCLASSSLKAGPKPRPASGRQAPGRWRSWRSRATSCRRKFSTGGKSRS